MNKNNALVIVESPAKAKTISRYLGQGYKVSASMGHVKDLPEKTLGVDVKNSFKPEYVIMPSRKKTLIELKNLSKGVDIIYLATDSDREGEAISFHLAEELRGNKKELLRLTFNEITKSAIQFAISHPHQIDINLVNAQQARRILDRLVGYMISPILSKMVCKGLSAGRVQSVAVRLICEREEEIEGFITKEYWSITAHLEKENHQKLKAKLEKCDAKKIEIKNQTEAENILSELKGKEFRVQKVSKREKKQYPVPPFITSTLQQEAARKLGFNAKKTMSVAQQLYEGLEIGESEPVGLITYMRTDSVTISKLAQDEARDYIKEKFGQDYLPNKSPIYKSKKQAQEAHEAIRPTSIFRQPDEIKNHLTSEQYKLYRLVWNRFTASQMNPAILDITDVDILAGRFLFRAQGCVTKFDGFMRIYIEGRDEEKENGEEIEGRLPLLNEKELLNLLELIPKQHFTQPPARYTEATLVKALEEKGIGRPSTYATIISTIQSRAYVSLNEKKFFPTELGKIITKLLIQSFPDILNIGFTAQMETELDKIEEGNADWIKVLSEFYEPFSQAITMVKGQMSDLKKVQERVTDVHCEKCGAKMVIKLNRNGKFLACSGYPNCQNIKNFEETQDGQIKVIKQELQVTDEICENCGKSMAIKQGRYGKFLACTGYPECKTIKSLNKTDKPKSISTPTDKKCDKCGGSLVLREGRYGSFLSCSNYPKCKFIKSVSTGKACPLNCGGELIRKGTKKGFFYGCTKYPECKFATWGEPTENKCPECGYMIVKKKSKGGLTILSCVREDCVYEEAVEQEE